MSLERYCSSYYDKHGLYNDGFPCPGDTFCCQQPDGAKVCCSKPRHNEQESVEVTPPPRHKSVTRPVKQRLSVGPEPVQSLFTTLSPKYQQPGYITSTIDSPAVSSFAISLPFTLTNSTILISICTSLVLIFLFVILLLVCLCRCCSRRHKTKKKSVDNTSLEVTKQQQHHVALDLTTDHLGNHYMHHHDYQHSDAITSTLKATAKRNKQHKANHMLASNGSSHSGSGNYSRNSSSSSSCTESTVAMSTLSGTHSASPKTLLPPMPPLSVCCEAAMLMHDGEREQDNDDKVTILSSITDSTKHFRRQFPQRLGSLNNRENIYGGSNHYMSSGNDLLLPPMPSLTGISTTMLTNSSFTVPDDDDDDGDFIVNTSSNLEFLKAHSLFSQTPMNFYPTLYNSQGSTTNKSSFDDASQYSQVDQVKQHMTPSSITPTSNNITNNNTARNTTGDDDFRFSTFLPPVYGKHHSHLHHELI